MKNKKPDKKEIENKLNLVIDKLMNLGSGLCFGSFLALWACLAFKLSGPPFYAGNNVRPQH